MLFAASLLTITAGRRLFAAEPEIVTTAGEPAHSVRVQRANKRTVKLGGAKMHLLLATHGWWPWLLLYAAIIAIVAYAVVFVMKRRRAR